MIDQLNDKIFVESPYQMWSTMANNGWMFNVEPNLIYSLFTNTTLSIYK